MKTNRLEIACTARLRFLREYTLGNKPVQIELLSDPDEGKAGGFSFVWFFVSI